MERYQDYGGPSAAHGLDAYPQEEQVRLMQAAVAQPEMMGREMGASVGELSQDGDRDNAMSVHEANRVKKAVESNVKSIENRIRFFQREEEKIWRDLEEVRRQAATIEEGRSRTLEKKLADRTIQSARENALQQNKARVQAQKSIHDDQKKRNTYNQAREKQVVGQEARKTSQDILRQKKMQEAQVRLGNSEKAVQIQRAQLEARLRVNQERAQRIDKMRVEQEDSRRSAEHEVQAIERRLPDLEAQEMICLQRLQNSRIVTQSVLEELESTLGSRSSVTSLLRSKQRQQDSVEGADLELDDSKDLSPGDALSAVRAELGSPGPTAAQAFARMGMAPEGSRPLTR